jgi:hypothetical protein
MARGADERAQEPPRPIASVEACLLVSRRLCDFVGGVGDSAACLSVGATLRSPRTLAVGRAKR